MGWMTHWKISEKQLTPFALKVLQDFIDALASCYQWPDVLFPHSFYAKHYLSMFIWHSSGATERVFASPCEPVYMMAYHCLADDATDMPRGAEGLGWFWFLESSSSSCGTSGQPLSLMSVAPEVRPNSKFWRRKQFYSSAWALSSSWLNIVG